MWGLILEEPGFLLVSKDGPSGAGYVQPQQCGAVGGVESNFSKYGASWVFGEKRDLRLERWGKKNTPIVLPSAQALSSSCPVIVRTGFI